MSTKGEIISGAYSKARISGLTKKPTAEDTVLALARLESMMHEFFKKNIDVSYFFEDAPDTSTPHNIPREYWDAIENLLSSRILADFGKEPTPALALNISNAGSFLSSATALLRLTTYPSRQPIGKGNRFLNTFSGFYISQEIAPLSSNTIKMTVGDVDIFTEHFDDYLRDSETIASYALTADSGLDISEETLASPDLTYTVTATGTNTELSTEVLEIKIVATTSLARKVTRKIIFELSN